MPKKLTPSDIRRKAARDHGFVSDVNRRSWVREQGHKLAELLKVATPTSPYVRNKPGA